MCDKGGTDLSNCFPIKASVRPGCVLSPTFFSSLHQRTMVKWRPDVEHARCGIDLGVGFADDMLLFARTAPQTIFLLESLIKEFASQNKT